MVVTIFLFREIARVRLICNPSSGKLQKKKTSNVKRLKLNVANVKEDDNDDDDEADDNDDDDKADDDTMKKKNDNNGIIFICFLLIRLRRRRRDIVKQIWQSSGVIL